MFLLVCICLTSSFWRKLSTLSVVSSSKLDLYSWYFGELKLGNSQYYFFIIEKNKQKKNIKKRKYLCNTIVFDIINIMFSKIHKIRYQKLKGSQNILYYVYIIFILVFSRFDFIFYTYHRHFGVNRNGYNGFHRIAIVKYADLQQVRVNKE